MYKERSKRLSAINVYITNVPLEVVPIDQVHALYSLRWQIALLFNTWKSFFQIDQCKEIKRELSEYKAVYIIKDYFPLLYQSLQKNTQELSRILLRLFHLLQKNRRKSHRYGKKITPEKERMIARIIETAIKDECYYWFQLEYESQWPDLCLTLS